MKGLRIYIIVGSLLLILYMVAQYNQPKSVNWQPSYGTQDKIPFGTYILYSRSNDIFPHASVNVTREPLYNLIVEEEIQNTTLLIICGSLDLENTEYEELVAYIKKGNNVFIATHDWGKIAEKELKVAIRSESDKNGQTFVNFTSNKLGDSTYVVDHGSSNGYFSKFDTARATVLGRNGYEHVTYLKMPMGKGALYLNANPSMFTNYSLLQPQGASYAATALSFLDIQKNVIWNDYYAKGREDGGSTMRVFLSHPSLRWAFYIVTIGLIIFVVYQSKRRQRIIPIIPPVANTSVGFATTVGQVYYEQRNNTNIAQKKLTYFLEAIRQRYHMRTNILDTELIDTLSHKSGVDIALVQDIFRQAALIQNGITVSDNDLLTFNRNIEQFYTQAG